MGLDVNDPFRARSVLTRSRQLPLKHLGTFSSSRIALDFSVVFRRLSVEKEREQLITCSGYRREKKGKKIKL